MAMLIISNILYVTFMGFPYSSDSKDPACNAGDPGSIPGSRRSSGEGNSNPPQYSPWENPHGQRSLPLDTKMHLLHK